MPTTSNDPNTNRTNEINAEAEPQVRRAGKRKARRGGGRLKALARGEKPQPKVKVCTCDRANPHIAWLTGDGEPLCDLEQATFMLALIATGSLPDWAEGDAARVLARLMNWPLRRASIAFERAQDDGYIERSV